MTLLLRTEAASRASSRSSLMILLLTLLLATCALHAQQSAPGSYRIAGRVMNATTGLPVRAATVSLLNEDSTNSAATTLTDPEGNFAFDRVPAGKYPLTASKRGFRTAFYNEHDEFSSAIVTGPGQDTTDLTFQLKPGAVLYGTITADGGDPVEAASVMLFKAPSRPGDRVTQVNTITTDDAGNYEFADLPAASYYIAVQAQPWYAMHSQRATAEGPSPLDVTYPITFFDSVTQESGASAIALEPGSRQQADISLHAVPAVHVRVAQGGPRNAPIDVRQTVFGLPVSATSIQDVVGTISSENGASAVTNLAPGKYVLTHGDPPRTVDLDTNSTQEIAADAGSPTVLITGSVRTSTGAALQAATVQLEPGPDAPGRAALEAPLEKGRFHIDGVAPGSWNLTVSAGGSTQTDAAVLFISQAGRSTAGNEITVADQSLNLTVVVSRSQATIHGFAQQAGKPASGAMIVLVPRDRRAFPSLARRDQSDSDGSFTLRDVPPGQYTAIAINGWNLDWQRFEVIRRFLAGGVPVGVPERPDAADSIRLSRPVEAANP